MSRGITPNPSIQPITKFESPVGSGSNDGAMPVAYDPNWQYFINLTTGQIAWFQAQPEWQNFLTWVALDPPNATIYAKTDTATIDSALATAGKTVVTTPLALPKQ